MGNAMMEKKFPPIFLVTVKEVLKKEDPYFFYCEFCAKKKHFFEDHMDQVVVDPVRKDRFIGHHCYFNHTTALRCISCRNDETRIKTFNGRKITDVSTFGGLDDTSVKVGLIPKKKVKGLHGWFD